MPQAVGCHPLVGSHSLVGSHPLVGSHLLVGSHPLVGPLVGCVCSTVTRGRRRMLRTRRGEEEEDSNPRPHLSHHARSNEDCCLLTVGRWNAALMPLTHRCLGYDDTIHHSRLAFDHVTAFLRHECQM